MTAPAASETEDGSHTPEFYVKNRDAALALSWLAKALPRIKTIYVDNQLSKSRAFDIACGENASPLPTLTEQFGNISDLLYAEFGMEPPPPSPPPPPPIDISILRQFLYLENLTLKETSLRGYHPFLFRFENLITLNLSGNREMEWDLSDLEGLPKLQNIRTVHNRGLTGNLRCLRVLKSTLVSIELAGCESVEGSIHDLADFPRLEDLSLNPYMPKITGDLRELGSNDFVAIKKLDLPEQVYGFGRVQRIADAPALMLAKYFMKKRSPLLYDRRWSLAEDAPERRNFDSFSWGAYSPPFTVEFVTAGPRIGWRWTNCCRGGSCEVQWIDSEPEVGGEGYNQYLEAMARIKEDTVIFAGYSSPPSEEEFHRIIATRMESTNR